MKTVLVVFCLSLSLLPSSLAWSSPRLQHPRSETFTGEVSAIALSRERLWVATSGGLAVHARDDGHHLFTLTAAEGLLGNRLNSLRLLGPGRLLVGSDFGVSLLSWSRAPQRATDVELRALRRTTHADYFDPVFALPHAAGRQYALGHQSGLGAVYLGKDPKRVRRRPRSTGMWRAACASEQGLVVGGIDGRVLRAPLDHPDRIETWVELMQPIVQMQCSGERVLVATGAEAFVLGAQGLRSLRLDGSEAKIPALSLAEENDGSLWIGTGDGRVLRLDEGRIQVAAKNLGGRVTALAVDDEQLWLGLGRRGLHRLILGSIAMPQPLRPSGEICDNHITHLTRFAGRLVAASFDHGVCVKRSESWVELAALPSPLIHGVAASPRYLYVATSNGLARYDRRLRPRPFGPGDAPMLRWFAGHPATAAARIGPREVAIASALGVLRILDRPRRASRVRYLSHEHGAPFAISALAGRGGELHIASEREGVAVFDRHKRLLRHLRDPDQLPEAWVTALIVDARQTSWVATCQSGLAIVAGGLARSVDQSRGLADDRVIAIATTPGGAFVGTLGGLSWVPRQGPATLRFGVAQGLPDARVSALRVEDDQLWVATEGGLSRWSLRHGSGGLIGLRSAPHRRGVRQGAARAGSPATRKARPTRCAAPRC